MSLGTLLLRRVTGRIGAAPVGRMLLFYSAALRRMRLVDDTGTVSDIGSGGGGVSAHPDLTGLAWSSCDHTAPADTVAAFDSSGLATTHTLTATGTSLIGAASAAAARAVLGLVIGTDVCAQADARLSDSRAPSGAAGGDLAGTYPSPTVAQVGGSSAATVAGQRAAHEAAYDHSLIPSALRYAITALTMAAGDGRHGSITLAAGGGSIVSGLIGWDAGLSQYTLLTDLQPNNLTINASVTLRTNGWRLLGYGTLTLGNGALIHADGSAASGTTAGAGAAPAAASGASTAGGGAGAAGGTLGSSQNSSGAANSNISGTARLGGASGTGGGVNVGGGISGSASVTGTAWSEATHGTSQVIGTPAAKARDTSTVLGGLGGASGAGRTGVAGSCTRGAGGGGGGAMMVAFPVIHVASGSSATIRTNGGTGSTGIASGGAAASGGCGGGGGFIRIVCGAQTGTGTLALQAQGGAAGASAVALGALAGVSADGSAGGHGGRIERVCGAVAGTITLSVTGGAGAAGQAAGTGSASSGATGTTGTTYACPAA